MVALATSSPETRFAAGVHVHPAMVDPAEAGQIRVPTCLLASKDEDPGDVQRYEAALAGPKLVETYPDQVHGWMAARADLDDERVRAEYKRGYETVLKFLSEHL